MRRALHAEQFSMLSSETRLDFHFPAGEFVSEDASVPQRDDTIGVFGQFSVVGDQDHGGLLLAVEGEQEIEHMLAIGAVEVPGRFIRHQDWRLGDEGARQRNPLLFAAGKLHWIVMSALREADPFEQFFRTLLQIPGVAAQLGGQQNIFKGCKCRDQLIRLKNEANFPPAQLCELILFHVGDVHAVQEDLAGRNRIQRCHQPKQRAFTATRCAHDGGKLASRHGETDVPQDLNPVWRVFDDLGHVSYFDYVIGGMHVNLEDVANRSFNAIFSAALAFGLILASCGADSRKETATSTKKERAQAPSGSTATARPAARPAEPEDKRPVIVAFGDSLTAGVVENTYPEYLQELLDKQGFKYRVENQGVSGDTTTDGLARIDNVVAGHPALVILEFGGNDGLRGIPVEATRQNMEEMITRLKAANIPVVLLGITLPPNYGPDYVKPFTAMYLELSKKYKVRLLPFLLVDVYQHPDMMQPDGIHPNDKGNKVLGQDVFGFIRSMLRNRPAPNA